MPTSRRAPPPPTTARPPASRRTREAYAREVADVAVDAHARRLLPWLVAVAFFMESLDTTILNTALPAMAAALHAPQHEGRADELHAELGGVQW